MRVARRSPDSNVYRRTIRGIRSGLLQGRWLFAWVFLAQFGHLIEHIAKAVTGAGLFGVGFDSPISHLLFNGAIAILSIVLIAVYARNPWVYPLCVLSVVHGLEHVFVFEQFMRTGVPNGPGLFGLGGALGVIPLERLELHNIYNGVEMILLVLGFWHETEVITEQRSR